MSYSYSFIAAKCKIHELESAVLEAWPTIEVTDSAEMYPSWTSAYEWATPRSGYLEGSHPDDVKFFFRDGDWAVIADLSLCMSGEEARLAELSRRIGLVMTATTQGTSGFAQFLVFEKGLKIRSITGENGHATQTGTPLPEEGPQPLRTFYLNELDNLWRRLGLTSFLGGDPPGPVIALPVHDRSEIPRTGPGSRRRPWWKFWN